MLEAQTVKEKTPKSHRKRSGWLAVFSLAVLTLILGFSLTSFFHPPSGDHISDSQKTQIAQEFAQVKNLRLAPVPADQMASAMDTMGLEQQQRSALEMAVGKASAQPPPHTQGDSVRMMWLELSDFLAQDGDSVLVTSVGYQATVPLFHAPTKIAVPVSDGQPIQISGVHDGGGGITLGIQTGLDGIARVVLAPGQVIALSGSF